MSSDDKGDDSLSAKGPGSVSDSASGSALGSALGSGSGWTASLKSLRQYIPTYGSKPEQSQEEDGVMAEPDPSSHQVTDYQEGERHDIHGNTVQFCTLDQQQQQQQHKTQIPTLSSAEQLAQEPKQQQRQHQQNEQQNQQHNQQTQPQREQQQQQQREGNLAKDAANKAVATITKAVSKTKRNLVLPDYYDQFPDVRPSLLLTVPVGQGDMTMVTQAGGVMVSSSSSDPAGTPLSLTGRVSMLFKSAASAIGSVFSFARSSGALTASGGSSLTALPRGTQGIRKVAILGIHGWYPRKALRTVIGEPTGTSQKFCDEMDLALKDYLDMHQKILDPEDIVKIPLEGEGKVLERVELLYQNLVRNHAWRRAVQEADLVLVATHSQGTPTSILLVARLIEEGLLRVQEDDPMMQRIGILTMAGISHGPFPFLKGNLIVRWFEAEAAGELFEFMDSESHIARKYRDGLRTVLSSGVRMTCVASLEDQVVPLYSAVMTSIHHPSIVRAVYIDGTSYQNDFLINLIAFSLRLRNTGVDDHGILVHLSEVIAGSLYGEGHSTIYDEREVYMLSIRSLLEPPASLTPERARSEPILNPFRAKQRLNPFYLPWGMRGVADEIMARGDQILIKELERVKKLYNDWNPVSKAMKEIKFRLEPVRSKL
ncbi:hypothetical protein BGZ96_005909 [Linnemannia gamsii]|uniref:YMC020W-like alpha/beta hydrolase domain-containing protein n=1 Tax=Linnemannia gamsii TaxID=64522 RepID=A0ABQ7K3T6_9FUNG|nr:hypothetical protein BGZ96_005909 [Linnemannia gamsii]